MRIDAISIGKNPPKEVNVIVEVPVGGEPIKYEMDKAAGTLVVDRFLYTSMRYPGNYGFIPHTLSDDGDPIDVLIANQRGIVPGALIAVRPVGVLKMQDEAGGDEKIVAVPIPKLTRRYENVHEYTDLPEITRHVVDAQWLAFEFGMTLQHIAGVTHTFKVDVRRSFSATNRSFNVFLQQKQLMAPGNRKQLRKEVIPRGEVLHGLKSRSPSESRLAFTIQIGQQNICKLLQFVQGQDYRKLVSDISQATYRVMRTGAK